MWGDGYYTTSPPPLGRVLYLVKKNNLILCKWTSAGDEANPAWKGHQQLGCGLHECKRCWLSNLQICASIESTCWMKAFHLTSKTSRVQTVKKAKTKTKKKTNKTKQKQQLTEKWCPCTLYPNRYIGPGGSTQQQWHTTTIDNSMFDTNTHSHFCL